jgi:hypothetical protein
MASQIPEGFLSENQSYCEDTNEHFAAAPINSEEQWQYLCKCEHVGSNGRTKHRQQE